MSLFGDIGRGILGAATLGTTELINEGTSGGLYGPGSTLFSNSSPPGLPYYQNPERPTYIPNFDPNTMGMQRYVEGLTSRIMPDMRGISKFRTEALRSGPSTWSKLARGQLAADEARQRSNLAGQAASQAAASRSELARRGGLSAGAAERLATNANRNAMMAAQGLAGQSLVNRAQIAAQDEANRIKMLQGLPSMEVEALRPAQWAAEQNIAARRGDIANTIAENQSRNAFNMDLYQELMRQVQANRNADVMIATAPKDRGLIGNIFGGLF